MAEMQLSTVICLILVAACPVFTVDPLLQSVLKNMSVDDAKELFHTFMDTLSSDTLTSLLGSLPNDVAISLATKLSPDLLVNLTSSLPPEELANLVTKLPPDTFTNLPSSTLATILRNLPANTLTNLPIETWTILLKKLPNNILANLPTNVTTNLLNSIPINTLTNLLTNLPDAILSNLSSNLLTNLPNNVSSNLFNSLLTNLPDGVMTSMSADQMTNIVEKILITTSLDEKQALIKNLKPYLSPLICPTTTAPCLSARPSSTPPIECHVCKGCPVPTGLTLCEDGVTKCSKRTVGGTVSRSCAKDSKNVGCKSSTSQYGINIEECHCSGDSCNGSQNLKTGTMLATLIAIVAAFTLQSF